MSEAAASSALARLRESDLLHSLLRTPSALIAGIVAIVCVAGAFAAPLIAPHDPFDLASLDLMDSFKPPAWSGEDGAWSYPLGTDNQGRDVFSAILYGARISLLVGGAALALSLLIGVTAGLLAGYAGGLADAALMRLADVQLTFPAILVALLVEGIATAALPRDLQDSVRLVVLVLAIGVARWPQFARTVRGSTLVERGRDYVLAARIVGVRAPRIMAAHILPNVAGPILVLATLNLGLAILDEATLSFLGLGLPATTPSLGTLIRVGNDFLFSGQWWITLFPGVALAAMVLSVNMLGDWLRDALNPRLR